MVQYSQVRPVTLGSELIEPASFVSPLDSGTTLPRRWACSWNCAFWQMKIERETSSRTSAPTTVAPWCVISTAG